MSYHDTIIKAILNGATVKVLVINPESKSTDIMRFTSPKTGIHDDIQRSLLYATAIAGKSKASLKGGIEVRLMDWIPSCSTIITDPEKKKGFMRLGIYTPYYKSPADKRAHMTLTAKKEKHWFDVYVEQFDLLWADAKPYALKD